MDALLDVKKLRLSFGDAIALHNVSLSIRKGELTAIIGGNGAGKTSLIRSISGIHTPQGGKILFKGKDITGKNSSYVCEQGVGHVAEGRQVFPNMSVLDNLLVGGSLKRSRANLKSNLERVYGLFPKLNERSSQMAGTLSGGEQQMLAIGRCLMGEPELILFDEPSLGLAPIMVKEMFSMISRLHASGLSIVLVEQNVVASLDIATYAYVLENGEVTLEGKASELLHDERVKASYLGL